jgi:ABC-2 type transport system permease protein
MVISLKRYRSSLEHFLARQALGIRKFWKTATMSAVTYVGDSPWFPLDYLLRLARVIVLLSIWRLLLAGKGPVSGMTLETLLTYSLISEAFAEVLECRTELAYALWDGSIATFFLQPMTLAGQAVARTFGRWGFSFCAFSIPLLLLSPLLGANPLPASVTAAAFFVVSLILATSIGFALEFVFLALTVAMDQTPWGIDQLRAALTTVLSGALIPLALMPWGIGDVFAWLPYASMASAPLRIYTGTGDALRLIPLQLVWSIILWLVASWIWRVNRERLVSYGG